MKNILVTGGAGYVGSLLCPQLLELGHAVTSFDICHFGSDFLPLGHPRFRLIKGDIRDNRRGGRGDARHRYRDQPGLHFQRCELRARRAAEYHDQSRRLRATRRRRQEGRREAVHLCLVELGLWRIGQARRDRGPPAGAAYLYNKYKGMCEPLLFKHQSDDFVCVTIRPATLCGYAPRQRLDLSVNILTNHAINNGKITVFGGSQLRPNLHVQDMCDLYKLLIDIDSTRIAGKIFNCGFQNMSIMDIALVVKRIVEAEFPEKGDIAVVTTPTDDIRSYHINSDKIQHELGFKPHFFIEDAVRDLCRAFKRGDLPNSLTDDRYFNVRTLKALRAA